MMKKLYRHLFTVSTMGLMITGLVSCDNTKRVEYEPANPVLGLNVAYFLPNTPTNYELDKESNTIDIPVYRTNTTGDLTVAVTVKALEQYEGPSVYSFPDAIHFSEGQDVTNYTITYDFDLAVTNEMQAYDIILDENHSSPYKLDYLSVMLTKPVLYTSLGWIEYTDAYMCALFYTGLTSYWVEIQECDDEPGLFRLKDPYGAAYPWNEPGDWDDSVTSYLYIDATNPDMVVIPESPQTLDWGYGPLICWCGAEYWQTEGYTAEELYEMGFFGFVYDGSVIYFYPETLMLFFGEDGPYYANLCLDEETGEPMVDEDGEELAPFWLDLNEISPTAPEGYSMYSTRAAAIKDKKLQKACRQAQVLSPVARHISARIK